MTKDLKKIYGLVLLAGELGATDVQATFIYVSLFVSYVTAFEGMLEYDTSQDRWGQNKANTWEAENDI